MARPTILFALLAIVFLTSHELFAEVVIAPIYSDGVVLQRGVPLLIWGKAEPGEKIDVTFGDSLAETIADKNGEWCATLGAQDASTKSHVLRVVGQSTVEINDVVVGDVYYAGGQSNMAMNVGACAKSMDEIKKIASESDYPLIRITRINDGPSKEQLDWLASKPKWTRCSSKSVARFSAAAFFCVREMHLETKLPIGIVDVSRGGTPIEPFLPESAFVDHPTLVRERELAEKDDLLGLQKLPGGVRARDANWLPGRLFNSRLAPLARTGEKRGFASAGCLWYQGESNCGVMEDPRDYRFKMQALISSWRAQLSGKDTPFCFVQLPGSGAGPNWPYLREQQRLAALAADEFVGMVVTIDLEHPDIHPPNKLDVGKRMAAFLLAKHPLSANRNTQFNGPIFKSARIASGKIEIQFTADSVRSGLMIAEKLGLSSPTETPDGSLRHFQLLDDQGTWHTAVATIVDGNRIEVTSNAVADPVAARYAYAISPVGCNLYNSEGLPASPFCTHTESLVCDPGLPK